MTYAFTFDSSACSGCKACQEACKDKNNLPVGVMWRRVVEVSGGGWVQDGEAWTNNVFAYNLSIACNHCVHPKCAGVCPTDAYITRPDGIIYIDPIKCMGCGYCSWACPYNAPRYNPELGQMAKCNFCFDNIDAGLPPSCVAACPMRVLNFVALPQASPRGAPFEDDKWQGVRALWEMPASEHPFPLPTNSRTEPHLMVKPHVAMSNSLEKKISNREEIKPKTIKSETSLVVFTLLVQMAVGAFWAAQWMVDAVPLVAYLIIGACLAIGGFFSFAHLGAKRNAWRAPFHLKKSWLSREILFVGLFGAGWLAGFVLPEMKWVTSLLGIGLVYSMAKSVSTAFNPCVEYMAHDGRIFHHRNFIGAVIDDECFGRKIGRFCSHGNRRAVGCGVGVGSLSETKSRRVSQRAKGGFDPDGDNCVGYHFHCPESD